ncbi:hypothetical protein [Nocardioides daeguensis]|uniref:Secreted protein n=1 Tax=Nocardioides daeguensis TaxID=908359 RepID=A0ABP6WIH3_9ACTN|nr:hypothetical protein [Nocardioides daeguensis]MBV6729167.1 hypothetical protein [Nocardioides daeguensis]MCR1774829.1 hypothetical protein [Nocardioides daeguensis]
MSSRTFTARVAVAAALLPLVAGCSDDENAKASGSESSPSASEQASLLPNGVQALPGPGEDSSLGAGRYHVPLDEALAYDVDLPAGSEGDSGGLYLMTPDFILKSEIATERYGVASDPCLGDGITPVGPRVADLVKAIRHQPGLKVSRPQPATLGGATGTHLRVRIDPAYDVSSCRDRQVNLPGIEGTNNNVTPAYVGE